MCLRCGFYVRASAIAPLSHTLPYLAFSPVFSVLVGFILLGESISTAGLSGVICVTMGDVAAECRRDANSGWLVRAFQIHRLGARAALDARRLILFGLCYGAYMFDEDRLLRNLGAAIIMLAGVALILLP